VSNNDHNERSTDALVTTTADQNSLIRHDYTFQKPHQSIFINQFTPVTLTDIQQRVVNDERRGRRCSLPLMLRSIDEDLTSQQLQHQQQMQLEDGGMRSVWATTMNPAVRLTSVVASLSSGYSTAPSLSDVESRKTSTTDPVVNVDDYNTDDVNDDNNDHDDDDSDDSSLERDQIDGAQGIDTPSNVQVPLQVGVSPQFNSTPENHPYRYQLEHQQRREQFAAVDPDPDVAADIEFRSLAAMSGQNADRRPTSKIFSELIREVLATLNANVATQKLAYWSLPSGRTFVVRHQYVTLVLEVIGGSQGLGHLLFGQVDGDVHCYRLLRDDLISRILF